MSGRRVLLVEDDPALGAALVAACGRLHLEPRLCATGRTALEALQEKGWRALVLDLGLPDMNGLVLLETLRRTDSDLPVLVLTAHGSLENALTAQRLGVETFLIKPVELDLFLDTLRQVTDHEPEPVAAPENTAAGGPLLVGSSPGMQRVLVGVAQACSSEVPVLLTGPTGAGKTMAARIIHQHSARARGPFVALTCGAMAESLLESELFGHERHAFTGAAAMKLGHIERAAGGTLLLDEIGDLAPALQVKLLRLIDEGVYHRVGGREDLHLDARIMAATHHDLQAAVRSGTFREDLYYRLRVLEIALPPLRERIEDIPVLCDMFLASLGGGKPRRLTAEARRLLERHDWPGNVRELRHAIEHAVASSSGHLMLPVHLPATLRGTAKSADPQLDVALRRWLDQRLDGSVSYDTLHDEVEGLLLRDLLTRYRGKPSVLARALGMNRVTLLRKRRLLGLG